MHCDINQDSNAGSVNASACSCSQGFTGARCLIQIPSTGTNARRFTIELKLSIDVKSEAFVDSSLTEQSPIQLIETMDLKQLLSSFFSASNQNVEITSPQVAIVGDRRFTSIINVSAEIAVKDELKATSAQMTLRKKLFEMFASTEKSRVTVSEMAYTCGQGYEKNISSSADADGSACKKCDANNYKHLLDDTACVACPAHSFSVNVTNAYSVEMCRCVNGRHPAGTVSFGNAMTLNDTNVYWVGKLECEEVLEK